MSSTQYKKNERDGRDGRDDELHQSVPVPTKHSQGQTNDLSMTEKLVLLASEAELFHSPDGKAYATIPVHGHRETYNVQSDSFRNWLRSRYYATYGKPATRQPLTDTIDAIAANAQFTAPERKVFVRVAEFGGNIYIDLGDTEWQAVEIRSDGWDVVSNPPVKFHRPSTLLPLPKPVDGGSLEELREHLNVGDDGWVLLVAWLVMACRPTGPYPVLTLIGEQGTSKSTTAKVLRRLLDPVTAPLRDAPKSSDDLLIGATNSWAAMFDNLSYVKGDLSDALCRLSTGGGLGKRRLYTDEDEKVLEAMRPVALTGISELATREDLLDRSIIVTLTRIPEERRLTERALWTRFDEAAPRILGALYDAVSTALRRFDSVHLERPPRMADFAQWVVAAEPSLPWEPGTFLSVYETNRHEAITLGVEWNPVAAAVSELMKKVPSWTGSATELLDTLDEHAPDRVTRNKKAWPQSATALSNRLRRAATSLRAIGVDVDSGRNHGGRFITLRTIRDSASQRHSDTQTSPTGYTYADSLVLPKEPASVEEQEASRDLRGEDDQETSRTLHSDEVRYLAQDLSSAFGVVVELSEQQMRNLHEAAGNDRSVLEAAVIRAVAKSERDDTAVPPVERLHAVLREHDHASLVTAVAQAGYPPYDVWIALKEGDQYEQRLQQQNRYSPAQRRLMSLAVEDCDEWEDE